MDAEPRLMTLGSVPAMKSSVERAERERAFFDNVCASTTPTISSTYLVENSGSPPVASLVSIVESASFLMS